MNLKVKVKIHEIIKVYNASVKGVLDDAMTSYERAFGGVIRSEKGKLVEWIAEKLVCIAWVDILGQDINRLKMNKKKMPIGVNDDYISRIKNPDVKKYVEEHKDELIYKFGTDVQVFVDNRLVLPIECKAYAENAMLKRILFDAELMKEAVGTNKYYLLQLESQLGGDYSKLNSVSYGSPATHALLAHCSVELEIITLLKGERKVDKPIHNPKYFKELEFKELRKAAMLFANDLRPFV